MPKCRLVLRWGIVLILCLAPLIAQKAAEPLTNAQLIQLLEAKMSTSLILRAIESAEAIKFDTSPAALIELKKAGAEEAILEAVLDVQRARGGGAKVSPTMLAPEKSDRLKESREPDFILRNFRTMFVNATAAQFFSSAQMKGALGSNQGFRALGISIVDDRTVADTVLEVSYTFAWDYPFVLKHQNTSVVLVSGKGQGAFSGPAGAIDVASRLVKLLKPYRTAPAAGKQ